jgi:PEP-CTERM motif
MSTRFSILAAAAVASLAFAQGASAIAISLSTPAIDLTGGAVTDSITISGLTAAGQEVTGYDLFIDFNPSVLSVTGVNFNPLPDDIGGVSNVDNVGGVVEINDFGIGPDGDFSVEGDSFTLGSITFTPLGGTGTSSPTFDLVSSQVTGLTDPSCLGSAPPEPQCPFPVLLTLTQSSGGGGTVPEPSTLALFGLGLGALGLAVTRRRRGAAGLRG